MVFWGGRVFCRCYVVVGSEERDFGGVEQF